MKEKIVLVTAGGHVSCFHAAMKEMHETLDRNMHARDSLELWGAFGGLGGLMGEKFIPINFKDIDENRAGSLIGADRNIAKGNNLLDIVKRNNIHAIVMMGGDNHLGEASELSKQGINAVGWPKTMDGDLSSLVTLGYETAVSFAAKQTRKHYSSAMTNRKVFYVGLFGRNTDWVPCAVAAYGGADRCIPCEQNYEWDFVWDKISSSVRENKEKYGVSFAVVPYSEGAIIKEFQPIPGEKVELDKHGLPKLEPEWAGRQLVKFTKKSGAGACFQAYTYSLRDEEPTETDKKLARMAGRECMRMILEGDFGKAVIFKESGDFYRADRAPIREVAIQRKLKPTGFFDYEELRPTQSFVNAYGRLFRDSLGSPPTKDQLVYRNMLK